jgi:hypothetical protein
MTVSRRPGQRLYDHAPRPVSRGRTFTEAQLDEALDRLLSDPEASLPISIMLKLECSNVTLKVTNPESVKVMIAAELQRRRQAREATA